MHSVAPHAEPRTGQTDAEQSMPLAPILDERIAHTLATRPALLFDLLTRYGSPLNIVWPHALKKNVDALQAVLNAHHVRSEIYYAAKVNKSQALVRSAVEAGVGIDVSSVHEFNDAVTAGATSARICASGPAKTAVFHRALISNGALVSVDSVEELQELETYCANTPGSRVRVLLRYRPQGSPTSRFGIPAPGLLDCLHKIAQLPECMLFEGFHFHLSGYGHASRVEALRELVAHIATARRLGLHPRTVDIGGGLPIRYVESTEYANFLASQTKKHYRNANVPGSFYPYGGSIDACGWLQQLLAAECVLGLSVAQYLYSQNLTLAIEPGRSLVDQAAISVFRITRVKRLGIANYVVFVEGSSFSACETWFASEFLVDPILVPQHGGPSPVGGHVQAYIAGHSCLDDDVLTNRIIAFPRLPQAGDLLVFANTAGYQMDLLENEFHRHPMPRRIAATYTAAGAIEVSSDDNKE